MIILKIGIKFDLTCLNYTCWSKWHYSDFLITIIRPIACWKSLALVTIIHIMLTIDHTSVEGDSEVKWSKHLGSDNRHGFKSDHGSF